MKDYVYICFSVAIVLTVLWIGYVLWNDCAVPRLPPTFAPTLR